MTKAVKEVTRVGLAFLLPPDLPLTDAELSSFITTPYPSETVAHTYISRRLYF